VILFARRKTSPTQVTPGRNVGATIETPGDAQLVRDAIVNGLHPLLSLKGPDTVIYTPEYAVQSKLELLQLLREFDARGLGGIPYHSILESYKAERDIEVRGRERFSFSFLRQFTLTSQALVLEGSVTLISNPSMPYRLLFYNPPELSITLPADVRQELQHTWSATRHGNYTPNAVAKELQALGIRPLTTHAIVTLSMAEQERREQFQFTRKRKPKKSKRGTRASFLPPVQEQSVDEILREIEDCDGFTAESPPSEHE
jgi:hypothetical protein